MYIFLYLTIRRIITFIDKHIDILYMYVVKSYAAG